MNEITRLKIFINHNTILYQMGKKISIGSDTEPIIQDEISNNDEVGPDLTQQLQTQRPPFWRRKFIQRPLKPLRYIKLLFKILRKCFQTHRYDFLRVSISVLKPSSIEAINIFRQLVGVQNTGQIFRNLNDLAFQMIQQFPKSCNKVVKLLSLAQAQHFDALIDEIQQDRVLLLRPSRRIL